VNIMVTIRTHAVVIRFRQTRLLKQLRTASVVIEPIPLDFAWPHCCMYLLIVAFYAF